MSMVEKHSKNFNDRTIKQQLICVTIKKIYCLLCKFKIICMCYLNFFKDILYILNTIFGPI